MSRDGCGEIGPPAPPNLLGFRRFHRDKGERCRRVFGPKTEVPNRRASDQKGVVRRTRSLQPDPCVGEALPENRIGPLKRQKLCASPGFALLPNCPLLTRPGTFFCVSAPPGCPKTVAAHDSQTYSDFQKEPAPDLG